MGSPKRVICNILARLTIGLPRYIGPTTWNNYFLGVISLQLVLGYWRSLAVFVINWFIL